MTWVRLILPIFMMWSLAGCIGPGMGGTDTGPAIAPESGDSPNDNNANSSLMLFSKQGIKDPNWIDTDQKSLNIADFTSYSTVNNETVFATDSIDEDLELYQDVHSHYFANDSENWQNYTFSGRVKIEQDGGSAGMTFYSQFPYESQYYRIRQILATDVNNQKFRKEYHLTFNEEGGWDSKHVCKKADGDAQGKYASGVVPVAGLWYHFEVTVITHADSTEIQAKIWPEVLPKPREFQIHCYDFRPLRLTHGTVGIWHGTWDKTNPKNYDGGRKFYDDFRVNFND